MGVRSHLSFRRVPAPNPNGGGMGTQNTKSLGHQQVCDCPISTSGTQVSVPELHTAGSHTRSFHSLEAHRTQLGIPPVLARPIQTVTRDCRHGPEQRARGSVGKAWSFPGPRKRHQTRPHLLLGTIQEALTQSGGGGILWRLLNIVKTDWSLATG